MSKKEVKEEVAAPQGIAIYADGSARPNPGYGGWGIHGYLYEYSPPKKGTGNPKYVLTPYGYLPKEEADKKPVVAEVTPLKYFDGFGSFPTVVTNNIAELVAAKSALQLASDYAIKDVRVYTDSDYVVKGFQKAEQWAKANWLKEDGEPRPNAEHWRGLMSAAQTLKEKNIDYTFTWVKGHGDIFGNILADKLSVVGTMTAKADITTNQINTQPAEGYWKRESNRHPMLMHRRCYFNTLSAFVRPGEYFIGDHSKDDEMAGKQTPNGAYAIVQLDQPDVLLEMVRDHQIKLAAGNDSIMHIRLDELYGAETYKDLSTFGTVIINQPNPQRLDLETISGEPLTREFRPPRLVYRVIACIEEMAKRLHEYESKSVKITITDLTSLLYETTEKTDKKGVTSQTMKLLPQYNVGFVALDVNANYQNAQGEIATAPIQLTMGLDMLDRNSLKRLEEALPRIELITWQEAPDAFRYATVVFAGKDKGIWCAPYSNLRVII